MFGFVKSHTSNTTRARSVRLAAFAVALFAMASVGAACGSDNATKSPTAARPTSAAPTGISGASTGIAGASTGVAGAVPADCESVIPTREVAQLVGASLVVVPGTPQTSGSAMQIVCRYLVGKDAPPERSVLLVVTGYANASDAAIQDARARGEIEQQGGSFTKIDGVGEEGYSFIVPAWSGVSTRLGTHTVSFGVGKRLSPQPASVAVTTLVQRILSDVGP